MAHRGGDGSSGGKRPNALTSQNKANASLWFLQQAEFGLRFATVQPPNYVPFFNRVSGAGGLMLRAW